MVIKRYLYNFIHFEGKYIGKNLTVFALLEILLFVTFKKFSNLFTHLIGTMYILCRKKMFKISVLMIFNMQCLIEIFAECDIISIRKF